MYSVTFDLLNDEQERKDCRGKLCNRCMGHLLLFHVCLFLHFYFGKDSGVWVRLLGKEVGVKEVAFLCLIYLNNSTFRQV